ncbi:DUF1405 domain-containing protein [Bacillus canaveralius]|uniref:DUF1405 domain-containing protein n=1 Tax=Bacillus canaveralius TaxID=1403243 RepID=A0A2N5GI28_9BACI|nr:DUF1405 domain-containing protein [Bacillus canaveralius]PLR80472.1 DUF1405 domain-containing protein [Bacillus canaveralius]PLS00663.1 DUF1405 domain-containing protein [Bacillus canaveralius]
MKMIYPVLASRAFLWMLLIINIAGTIYGYVWYQWQLADTPPIFLPFVPDSPTASLFFVFVLIAFLLKKNWGLLEALAIVTLFKYGIWAVVMNLLVYVVNGQIDLVSLMLIFSHLGMAVQGLLYAPFYRIKLWHFVVTAIWVLHNEIIDYVFLMMPRYQTLNLYIQEIGYFTFWLSIFSLEIAYILCLRKDRFILKIKT